MERNKNFRGIISIIQVYGNIFRLGPNIARKGIKFLNNARILILTRKLSKY